MTYEWDFSVLFPYRDAFLRGLVVTCLISLVSFLAGTVVGIPAGFALFYMPMRRVLMVLNDAIRAVPPLVLIFLVYYFPVQTMFGLRPPSGEGAAMLALAVAQAAYTADLVRGAIGNVSKPTVQGALALGLSTPTIWRYIVLPDIARQILPAQMAFLIGTIRLSSLASVVGAQEVVYTARVITAQTFRSLEGWIAVAALYVAIVVPLTVLSRRFEESKWLLRRA